MSDPRAPEHLIDVPNQIATAKLGRLVSIDPRDRKHPMNARKAPGITEKYYNIRTVLDQGSTPHCVAYAWTGLLMAGPVTNRKGLPHPQAIYDAAQRLDEWEGEDYDGTSVRAGAKVLEQLGYLSEYVWAESAQDAALWVLSRSPVVAGTDWLEGMNTPDRSGYIWPTGDVYGGHAWLILGVDIARRNPDGTIGALRMQNTWGRDWGQEGRAWIAIHSFDVLLTQRWGEASAPTEIKKR